MGRTITAANIKAHLVGKESNNRKMILEIFREHNHRLKKLFGSQFAPATLISGGGKASKCHISRNGVDLLQPGLTI